MHQYGDVVALVQDQELEFPDFNLIYKGQFLAEEDPQTTASVASRIFVAEEKASENTEELKIYHGQTPPQNCIFKLGTNTYELLTHKTKKGEQLFDKKIVVLRKRVWPASIRHLLEFN